MKLLKNITVFEVLTFIIALAAFIMITVMFGKVDKCCKKNENFLVRDMGPNAGNGRVTNPSQSFVQNCNAAFQQGCASGGATVNVCGADDGSVGCQDYTDMDDTNCSGSQYIAYQQSDCAAPLNYTPGYLCGGNTGVNGVCADTYDNSRGMSAIIGKAPPNPYGCTNICN